MGFIVLILGIVVWFHFSRRISSLEDRIKQLESLRRNIAEERQTAPLASDPVPPRPIPPPDPYFAPNASPAPSTGWIEEFIEWGRQDFLMKIGAGLLLIALGWFVSYAFANDWIGPQGRIALGLIASAAFLGFGGWRMRYSPRQGSVFMVIGGTGILLTVFAAREIYGFFTPPSMLAVAFLTTVLIAFFSVQYDRRSLAFAGLILGSTAPLLVNVSNPDPQLIFLYLFLIAGGTLWVVWLTGWTSLILGSLLITYLYSVSYLVEAAGDRTVAVLYSFLFIMLYFLTNIVSAIRRHGSSVHHMRVHAYVAAGLMLFLFTWIQAGVSVEWQSLVYLMWAFVFMGGTYVTYLFTSNRWVFYLYGATSAALIGLATAAELSGAVLVIAFTFEIVLLSIVLAMLLRTTREAAIAAWLFALPITLSLSVLEYWRWDQAIGIEFSQLVVLAGGMVAVATFLQQLVRTHGDTSELIATHTAHTLQLAAAGIATYLVWAVTHLSLPDGLATTICLALYTVVGLGLLRVGQATQATMLQAVGGVYIGFVVLRLLFIDVWEMSIEGRIVTFFLIGIMLLSTAFWRQRAAQVRETTEVTND